MFRKKLGDTVVLKHSTEQGEVIARAEYANAEDSYLVRYVAADGSQVENWQSDSALA